MSWGVDDLEVIYDDSPALTGVSLSVVPGNIAVVVGGDGAGKTTLCRAIVGLEASSSGRVMRPARVGYQPATSGVWRDMTVMENLELVAGAYRLESARAAARIGELLEVTRLGEASRRLGGQLSGGMRQKLGVAMAVLSEPELLVLDEPTTGVDPVSRLELWSFITRSAKEDRAVIVTTSYLDETLRGDSVLALDGGAVLASGTVDEVVASMPGAIFESPDRLGTTSWRRGRAWRFWSPDGSNPGHLAMTTPDISDVVTVAALRGEVSR